MSYLQMLQSAQRDGSPDAPSTGVRERAGENRQIEFGIDEALRLLNLAGVRIIRRGSDLQIGIWEDLVIPEVGAAIRTVGLDVHTIIHLESADVDLRYKVRRTPDRAKSESFAAWLTRAEQALPSVVAAYKEA